MSELLKIEDVSVYFPSRAEDGRKAVLRAVEDISLSVHKGETLAVVGESGSGKTTLGHVVAGLRKPSSGKVTLLDKHSDKPGSAIQIIFQDPFSALDPRMLVADIVAEPLRIARQGTVAQRRTRAVEALSHVGLPAEAAFRYPHEFSGGQRQRIAIARSIITDPVLIVADEPLSALDVSIQSQILNQMKDIQAEQGLSYLFISHDLAVVHHLADRVAIMYLGRLMEIGTREEIYASPSHPYTRALLESMPRIGRRRKGSVAAIKGEIPSPISPPSGCVFHTRCPKVQNICRQQVPILESVAGRSDQSAACHFKD